MRLSSIKKTDVANGPGIRVSIFVSGCRHLCKGCFNSDIWDFKKGEEFTENDIDEIISLAGEEYIQGVTLLGGEPLDPMNTKGILKIVKSLREKLPNKDIWCFTGFMYEYILDVMIPIYPEIGEILSLVDVLIDGRFEIDYLDLKLKFRGSKNQRVIDLRKTEKSNEIIWALPPEDGIDKYVELKDRELMEKSLDRIIRKGFQR